MNRFFRKILAPLPFVVRWYVSKERTYHHQNLSITVMPGVFHPGLFFSTNMLLEFIKQQNLKGAVVLEVGAGTGILSLVANKMGATVTATDISSIALENIHTNAKKNNASISIVRSDLFTDLPPSIYDWIFVNPPYYPKQPKKEEEFAWYCGEQHEYFINFFRTIHPFLSDKTRTIMVLSDVCDLATIFKIAAEHGFQLMKVSEKKIWIDGKNYIFEIKQTA
jgi:release factor glutamine methyltransferase